VAYTAAFPRTTEVKMPASGFGPLVRDLMTEHGLSLRALARRLPVDPGQLSRVLNGKRPAGPALAEACDRVFGTGDLLTRIARQEGSSNVADPDEGAGTGRRRVLLAGIAAVASGAGLLDQDLTGPRRRFGREDVARIDAVLTLYRSLDYEFGGDHLHRDVGRFAEGVSRFADDASSVLVAPKLLSAIASARQLAGWTAFDAGHHTDAQRHFLHAERTAHAGGNHLLTARIRYCQARQFQHLHHNRDALATLRLAREQLGARATPAVAAMLHGAEAASLAALDDKGSAVKSLASASAAFERVKADGEPEWTARPNAPPGWTTRVKSPDQPPQLADSTRMPMTSISTRPSRSNAAWRSATGAKGNSVSAVSSSPSLSRIPNTIFFGVKSSGTVRPRPCRRTAPGGGRAGGTEDRRRRHGRCTPSPPRTCRWPSTSSRAG
jgi:transcriptional regulator with XRE-family HTH domain